MAQTKDIAKAMDQKQLTPTQNLGILLNQVSIKKKFEEMLGKRAPAFMSSILSLSNAKTQLRTSDPMSIIQAAAIAATLDLPINPNLGFAHIVPYAGVATFQMGWKGFVQLAIRTGMYRTMNATEIYEGELVKYNRITGETEIDESKRTSDKIVAYMAYFKLTSGFEKSLFMTVDQVTKHAKRYSKAFTKQPDSIWHTNFEAMALKTVLKLLLSKYGVLSIEMQKAVTYDEARVKETMAGEIVEYPDAAAEIELGATGPLLANGAHLKQAEIDEAAGTAQEPA